MAEPLVARHSAADQILVQLPGVTDVNRAKEIIRSTAQLELKQVEQGPFSDEAAARQALGNNLPPDMQILPGTLEAGPGQPAGTGYYVVRRVPAVTGRDLRNARPTLDENNRPAVSFSLNQEGARKFGNFTQANIGKQLAIVMDNRVVSAPQIQSRIDDEGRITGNFTTQESQDLSLVLRSGALPANLTYLEERTVGPSLGADSIRAGVISAVGGLALVTLFMLGYYRLAGFNALISIAINLIILLGLMAYAGATMTLPGIAGFILTIGMGVDSNVLIFERIKEELATAKGVKAAVGAGFDRVLLTILDTHVASLIAAAFLFNFGTGSDPRVCVDADHRPARQRLHGLLRVANLVRADAVEAAGREAFHLGLWPFFKTRTTTSSSGAGTPSPCRRSSSSPASPTRQPAAFRSASTSRAARSWWCSSSGRSATMRCATPWWRRSPASR